LFQRPSAKRIACSCSVAGGPTRSPLNNGWTGQSRFSSQFEPAMPPWPADVADKLGRASYAAAWGRVVGVSSRKFGKHLTSKRDALAAAQSSAPRWKLSSRVRSGSILPAGCR
jgi:hypothetical protein